MNNRVQCENFRGVKDITHVKQCVHSEFDVVMVCKLFKCIFCFVFVRSFQVCVVWCSSVGIKYTCMYYMNQCILLFSWKKILVFSHVTFIRFASSRFYSAIYCISFFLNVLSVQCKWILKQTIIFFRIVSF